MSTAAPILARKAHKPPPSLTLWDQVHLPLRRAHEVCGRARRSFAMMVAGQICAQRRGPVLWIAPSWSQNPLNPDGMVAFAPPQEVIFATPTRMEDVLWCMEEGLRAGCVPLVIAEMDRPLAMTPVRRLHLAAETGAGFGKHRPLGLLLTPDGGTQGIETRYDMQPAHRPGTTAWQLTRQRARLDPPKTWQLTQGADGMRLDAAGP